MVKKNKREFVQSSGRILQSRAESQRIAAWELLNRVRHPGRYVSRLQTILHSDIIVNDRALEDDQHNAIIAVKVAGFPPHANLARLLTVRTAFTDLNTASLPQKDEFRPYDIQSAKVSLHRLDGMLP